jgi:hypothetical protein
MVGETVKKRTWGEAAASVGVGLGGATWVGGTVTVGSGVAVNVGSAVAVDVGSGGVAVAVSVATVGSGSDVAEATSVGGSVLVGSGVSLTWAAGVATAGWGVVVGANVGVGDAQAANASTNRDSAA